MITRQEKVEQSITDYVKAGLTARGYDALKPPIKWVESFPGTLPTPLEHTFIAAGYNFDDDEDSAECGSDLVKRPYTAQFFVVAPTLTIGRNVANVIKFIIDGDGTLPLYDIEQDGNPEFDRLMVDGVSSAREIVADPQPWQEFIYSVTLKVTDEYYAELV